MVRIQNEKVRKTKELIGYLYSKYEKCAGLFSNQCVGSYNEVHVEIKNSNLLCEAAQAPIGNKKEMYLKFCDFRFDDMEEVSCVTGEYVCYWTEKNIYQQSFLCHITVFFLNDKIVYFRVTSDKEQVNCIWLTDVGGNRYKVKFEDIMFLESLHNHVRWNTKQTKIETVDLLKYVQTFLSKNFIRMHRGYIVNSDYVCGVKRCKLILTDGTEIPIPKNKYTEVRNKLTK